MKSPIRDCSHAHKTLAREPAIGPSQSFFSSSKADSAFEYTAINVGRVFRLITGCCHPVMSFFYFGSRLTVSRHFFCVAPNNNENNTNPTIPQNLGGIVVAVTRWYKQKQMPEIAKNANIFPHTAKACSSRSLTSFPACLLISWRNLIALGEVSNLRFRLGFALPQCGHFCLTQHLSHRLHASSFFLVITHGKLSSPHQGQLVAATEAVLQNPHSRITGNDVSASKPSSSNSRLATLIFVIIPPHLLGGFCNSCLFCLL